MWGFAIQCFLANGYIIILDIYNFISNNSLTSVTPIWISLLSQQLGKSKIILNINQGDYFFLKSWVQYIFQIYFQINPSVIEWKRKACICIIE